MTDETWAERSRALAAAGLIVMGQEAKNKIEDMPSLSPLFESAAASETRLLTGQVIDELLAFVPTEATIEASAPTPLASPINGWSSNFFNPS